MYNLLVDPLIRVQLADGSAAHLSLPDVYSALTADRVAAFPALRPHQRHALHAFLCQSGAIALHRAGWRDPVESADEWRSLLRGTTPGFADDQPWSLVVDEPGEPAFMQCPAPQGLQHYRGWKRSPDDLDLLVSAKNHDIKQTTALQAAPEDWLFALIDLQTMGGYLGAGNYPIARMNGGYSSRPCVGLAPAVGGLGAHICFDIKRMLAGRDALLDNYPDYFRPNAGVALTWLEPWDGTDSLALRVLDPYFIEICRRIRLSSNRGSLVARTAPSRAPRVYAKMAGGDIGDFWTPVRTSDNKGLSLSSSGFRYDRLAKIAFDRTTFHLPPAMHVDSKRDERWRLIARGVAAGQGKTDGYHERTDIAFAPSTVSALGRTGESNTLAKAAQAQLEEVEDVMKALRFGIAVAAGGGRDANELTRAHRIHAGPYARRLDAEADARFFSALEDRHSASMSSDDPAAVRGCRASFVRSLIRVAERLLDEAIETVPCPSIQRPRARARAVSAFWGRLRGSRSVFSDQPEIFDAAEADHDA
ncbi:MAG: hypothetical protein OXH96_07380 [Spirochaetaceae bacterium]|nr:hypothetical protein [Spirochaetaceae bacterium]